MGDRDSSFSETIGIPRAGDWYETSHSLASHERLNISTVSLLGCVPGDGTSAAGNGKRKTIQ
jgi:hypothetical protein